MLPAKLTRARTLNKITRSDQERFEKEFNLMSSNRASDDLQARDVSMKAAKEFTSMLGWQVDELQEEREKLLERIGELEVTVSELNNSVAYSMSQLQTTKCENEILRSSLREAEQEAQTLRLDLKTKTRDVVCMEEHVKKSNIESEFLKRNYVVSDSLLVKNKQENTRLKLEVNNSIQTRSLERQETKLLVEDIAKADKKIKLLTKRLEEALQSYKALEEDNTRQEFEITTLKNTLQGKLIELSDTKQEVEFLRRPKAGTRRSSNIFQFSTKHCVFESESENESRVSTYMAGQRTSTRSDIQQNMFIMLQSLRGADLYTSDMMDVKEARRSDTEHKDDILPRASDTHRQSEIIEMDECVERSSEVQTRRSVDEHLEVSMAGEQEQLKIDILDVYAHLTAAAVKSNYPDIDIPNARLLRLGESMPFWELHPYFTHIFESIKEKNGIKQRSTTRNRGWFSWMRKGEQSETA